MRAFGGSGSRFFPLLFLVLVLSKLFTSSIGFADSWLLTFQSKGFGIWGGGARILVNARISGLAGLAGAATTWDPRDGHTGVRK